MLEALVSPHVRPPVKWTNVREPCPNQRRVLLPFFYGFGPCFNNLRQGTLRLKTNDIDALETLVELEASTGSGLDDTGDPGGK